MSKRADRTIGTEETPKTLMGFPVKEADDLPSLEGEIVFGDMSAYIVPVGTIPASTPINDALAALRNAGVLSEADCRGAADLPGVRTLGDLVTVLGRGDVEGKLAAKLRKVLG